jgi:hypothetical protein
MKSITVACACLLTVFLVGAFGTAPAWAAEGPFYKVNGVRLVGEKAIKAKITEEYVFKVLTVEATVRCKEMTYGAGALRGLNAKTSDSGKGVVTLKMCTVEGNGAGCAVENSEIKTETLTTTLAYSEPSRKGKILILLKAAPLATIKFTGANCVLVSGELLGSFAGEVLDTTRKSIAVEGSQAEAVVNYIKFPTGQINTVYTETAGTEKTEKVEMELKVVFTFTTTITGESEFELGPSEIWSAYTK